MPHRDVVGAALERPGLHELDATEVGRLEAHAQLLRAVLSSRSPGTTCITVLCVESPANQTRLGQVDTLGAVVEQHKVLAVIDQVRAGAARRG